MQALFAELEASVEFGSGYVCVVGPPSSGKTDTVLSFLVERKERLDQELRERRTGQSPAVAVDSDAAGTTAPQTSTVETDATADDEPVLLVEYWSACSFNGDALSQMARQLQLSRPSRRRRLAHDCSATEFGYCVEEWMNAHAVGSELHLVVDDADCLEEEPCKVEQWLSGCGSALAMQDGKKLCLWLISQLPLRLPVCFRYHFLCQPSVAVVSSWLARDHESHRDLQQRDEDEARLLIDASSSDRATTAVSTCVMTHETMSATVEQAVRYYATHRPMCASAVSKDVRLLLRRVYQLLPALVASAGRVEDGNVRLTPNARDYSIAWGSLRETRPSARSSATVTPGASGAADPLVGSLRALGYSAVLLGLAAFYVGAVPREKHFDVPAAGDGRRSRRSDANRQSHKAAVLTASSHIILLSRLIHVYRAMKRMCVQHIDPIEFAPTDVLGHYVNCFQTWGLLTPVAGSSKRKRYHCWIPVSTAVQLGHVLSLNLYDLVPS